MIRSQLGRALVYPRISRRALTHVRFYSNDDKVSSKGNDKYSSIDEFNKQKKEYVFGSLNESENAFPKQNTQEIHRRLQNTQEEDNINVMIENDPRLANLKPGSPDYKYQMHLIHQEFQQKQKHNEKKEERNERLKAVGAGIALLVGIISIHQLVMNYEYLKKYIMHKFTFTDLDESKVRDLTDPTKNRKNINYLVDKLLEEFTKNPAVLSNLVTSTERSGLYLFGDNTKQKLPFRVPFFNDILIKQVSISKRYVVVVDESGKVYHLYDHSKQPEHINLPAKIQKAQIVDDFVYYLSEKGKVFYTPRLDVKSNFEGVFARNWLGINTQQHYQVLDFNQQDNTLVRGERVSDFASGKCHLLMLTNKGRLFINNTSTTPENKGQFGLPRLSPYTEHASIPVNTPLELKNLNNEVVTGDDGQKFVKPRQFTKIASGKYHNVVIDTSNNVWTWGQNLYGECCGEISYNTDIQPVPRRVLGNDDYTSLTNHLIANPNKNKFDWQVQGVFANDETTFVKLKYADHKHDSNSQDVLISFGNGIKGQLGNSRYLHVCPQPQVVKSLMNMSEYDESLGVTTNIGIKDVSVGNNHVFITLNNSGEGKDVFVFGDNEFGQYGNGKRVRSAKPIQLPKLLEPSDVSSVQDNSSTLQDKKHRKKLARKIYDVMNARLQLSQDLKLQNGQVVEQVIAAGEDGSAIFYRKN